MNPWHLFLYAAVVAVIVRTITREELLREPRGWLASLCQDENRSVSDLSRRELAILVPLVALMLWVGVQPAAFLRRMEPSVEAVLARVQSQAPVVARIGER